MSNDVYAAPTMMVHYAIYVDDGCRIIERGSFNFFGDEDELDQEMVRRGDATQDDVVIRYTHGPPLPGGGLPSLMPAEWKLDNRVQIEAYNEEG